MGKHGVVKSDGERAVPCQAKTVRQDLLKGCRHRASPPVEVRMPVPPIYLGCYNARYEGGRTG